MFAPTSCEALWLFNRPVPLVLLPRRLVSVQIQGGEVGVLVRPAEHWAETLLSVLLAAVVGLTLRVISATG